MQTNVREDHVSMHTHAKIWLGTIDASAKRAGLGKTVTITSMIVWGSANMELLALIWSTTITVPVSLGTQVNVTHHTCRTCPIIFVMCINCQRFWRSVSEVSPNPKVILKLVTNKWTISTLMLSCFTAINVAEVNQICGHCTVL